MRTESGWQNQSVDLSRQEVLEQLEGGMGQGRVTVSTIHAAKGLEFAHVFIVGCAEGLIPFGSPPEGDALEEERRLMYVGVTRAEDTLHLSYAEHKDGSAFVRRTPSRFIHR